MSQTWVDVPFEVQKPQHGLRLDAYLARRLQRYSRASIQRLIAEGKVTLSGRAAKPATRVCAGQTVVIRYPKASQQQPSRETLTILYEDDWLLAVDKPGDMLAHPTDKVVDNSVTSVIKKQFPDKRLHLAHRLDRETSGVLLLSKDAATASLLTAAFFERNVSKEYAALVHGRVSWSATSVDAPIARQGGEIRVRQAVGAGQPAITEFERLSAGDSISLVAARPKTGRLHQIRVHLAHLGHPILGDKLYLGDGAIYMKAVRGQIAPADLERLGAARQMLHAGRLTLKHPVTEELLTICAPLPADFSAHLDHAR